MAYESSNTVFVEVTLSLEATALDAGDVAADTQVVSGVISKVNGTGKIKSLVLVDQDDVKAALTLWFLRANVVLGTEDSAPSISDTDALNIIGCLDVATGDYRDLGGVAVAYFKNVDIPIKTSTGTNDIYVAATVVATPDYTAAGIKLILAIEQE
jgi:hypothetical protein